MPLGGDAGTVTTARAKGKRLAGGYSPALSVYNTGIKPTPITRAHYQPVVGAAVRL